MFLYAVFCYNILYIPKVPVMQFKRGEGERAAEYQTGDKWDWQPGYMETTDKAIEPEMPLSSLSGKISISFN